MNTQDKNLKSYSSARVVEFYKRYKGLQLPEKKFIEEYESKMRNWLMCDLGVGAARTTPYFSKMVKNYIGIDYSPGMIELCQKQFPQFRMEVGDARNLEKYPDNYFDFVLFSFNGIDALDHNDRMIAFAEIHRILKRHGLFFFSSHNINHPHYGRFLREVNPKAGLSELVVQLLKAFVSQYIVNFNVNFKKQVERGYGIINDGSHWAKLKTYYISKDCAVEQLNKIGFKLLKTYPLHDSAEYSSENDSWWLYYLCEKEME